MQTDTHSMQTIVGRLSLLFTHLISSPTAVTPNISHTAGHSFSRHVTKSSSMLKQTSTSLMSFRKLSLYFQANKHSLGVVVTES